MHQVEFTVVGHARSLRTGRMKRWHLPAGRRPGSVVTAQAGRHLLVTVPARHGFGFTVYRGRLA